MDFNSFNSVDKTRKEREAKYASMKGHSSNWSNLKDKLNKLYGWRNKNTITDLNKFHKTTKEKSGIKNDLNIIENPSLADMVKLVGLIGNSQYIIDFGDGKYGFADIPKDNVMWLLKNKNGNIQFHKDEFINIKSEDILVDTYKDSLPCMFYNCKFYHVSSRIHVLTTLDPNTYDQTLVWVGKFIKNIKYE